MRTDKSSASYRQLQLSCQDGDSVAAFNVSLHSDSSFHSVEFSLCAPATSRFFQYSSKFESIETKSSVLISVLTHGIDTWRFWWRLWFASYQFSSSHRFWKESCSTRIPSRIDQVQTGSSRKVSWMGSSKLWRCHQVPLEIKCNIHRKSWNSYPPVEASQLST